MNYWENSDRFILNRLAARPDYEMGTVERQKAVNDDMKTVFDSGDLLTAHWWRGKTSWDYIAFGYDQ
ncbi:MAG: hypothetical protein R3B93_16665 [Bacteroidia bacterium]